MENLVMDTGVELVMDMVADLVMVDSEQAAKVVVEMVETVSGVVTVVTVVALGMHWRWFESFLSG